MNKEVIEVEEEDFANKIISINFREEIEVILTKVQTETK